MVPHENGRLQVLTLRDAVQQRIDAEADFDARHTSTAAAPMHPAIGILCRRGVTVYYAYVGGYTSECYREGSVSHLTCLLANA